MGYSVDTSDGRVVVTSAGRGLPIAIGLLLWAMAGGLIYVSDLDFFKLDVFLYLGLLLAFIGLIVFVVFAFSYTATVIDAEDNTLTTYSCLWCCGRGCGSQNVYSLNRVEAVVKGVDLDDVFAIGELAINLDHCTVTVPSSSACVCPGPCGGGVGAREARDEIQAYLTEHKYERPIRVKIVRGPIPQHATANGLTPQDSILRLSASRLQEIEGLADFLSDEGNSNDNSVSLDDVEMGGAGVGRGADSDEEGGADSGEAGGSSDDVAVVAADEDKKGDSDEYYEYDYEEVSKSSYYEEYEEEEVVVGGKGRADGNLLHRTLVSEEEYTSEESSMLDSTDSVVSASKIDTLSPGSFVLRGEVSDPGVASILRSPENKGSGRNISWHEDVLTGKTRRKRPPIPSYERPQPY